MTKPLAIIILLTFLICGYTYKSNGTANEVNPKWKTFEGTGYSIQYPSDWELNQSRQMGTDFIFFSPLESPQDQFKENVNLLTQDLSGYTIDLDEYTEISEKQIKTLITNSTLIESKRIKNGSNEYHHLIYTGDQGIFHLRFEQYYWIRDKKAFVLTFTCEQDKIEKYKESGAAILNSFTFKK